MKKDCCPYCFTEIPFDTATLEKESVPSIGDISICAECSGMMRYKMIYEDGSREFEKITIEFLKELKETQKETYNLLRHAILFIRKERSGGIMRILFATDEFEELLNPMVNQN